MIHVRFVCLFGMAVLVAGCSQVSSLRTRDAGGIRNIAVLHYGFGEETDFTVQSNPVRIRVRVPDALTIRRGDTASAGHELKDAATEHGEILATQESKALDSVIDVRERSARQKDRAFKSLQQVRVYSPRVTVTLDRAGMESKETAGKQGSDESKPRLVLKFTRAEVSPGESMELVLTITNRSGLSLTRMVVEDELGPDFLFTAVEAYEASGKEMEAAGEGPRLSLSFKEALPPGGVLEIHIPLQVAAAVAAGR